ncbi:protein of unknown function [Palleronia marisminoris]|uniref:DUF3291 domain-containing protein n=1 Tax=Palleronia marisminoris TaxID=315423 RepID=A0A1Y5SSA6_9RHOB|nr:DUF3291 domain-containing protein [Palleronia marisminoris]SFG96363.1 protein of unknown function [Palleronia marisminoris]SLN47361.1 hypothetical protein PAM7066_02090 [Palleronia marisminoris]
MSLALYTFGQFAGPADSPVNDGFRELNDPIFALADRTEGLIARSGYASDAGPSPWGEEVYPRFYDEAGDGWSPATLSLWEDLESLYVFTYSGLHAQALKRGREWFRKPSWPPLVLWWHDGKAPPTWRQGVRRLEHLHDHGTSSFAFSFKSPFDENGRPVNLDAIRIRDLRGR